MIEETDALVELVREAYVQYRYRRINEKFVQTLDRSVNGSPPEPN